MTQALIAGLALLCWIALYLECRRRNEVFRGDRLAKQLDDALRRFAIYEQHIGERERSEREAWQQQIADQRRYEARVQRMQQILRQRAQVTPKLP